MTAEKVLIRTDMYTLHKDFIHVLTPTYVKRSTFYVQSTKVEAWVWVAVILGVTGREGRPLTNLLDENSICFPRVSDVTGTRHHSVLREITVPKIHHYSICHPR